VAKECAFGLPQILAAASVVSCLLLLVGLGPSVDSPFTGAVVPVTKNT